MKHVLITGGSKGIGAGIVKSLLEDGYTVYNLDKVQETYEKSSGYNYINLDLLDELAIDHIWDTLPHIDALICNAATFDKNDFLKQPFQEIKDIVQVNVMSMIQLAKGFAAQYTKDSGRIVLLSSTRAFMSEPNTIGYSVSKGAIEALTHSLAITLQDKNITCNAIAPGWINSHNKSLRDLDHDFHPSNRVGTIEDIVRVVQFLLDKDAQFITGESITVDGGVTKKMVYPE